MQVDEDEVAACAVLERERWFLEYVADIDVVVDQRGVEQLEAVLRLLAAEATMQGLS